jgi:hypothetical protein
VAAEHRIEGIDFGLRSELTQFFALPLRKLSAPFRQ